MNDQIAEIEREIATLESQLEAIRKEEAEKEDRIKELWAQHKANQPFNLWQIYWKKQSPELPPPYLEVPVSSGDWFGPDRHGAYIYMPMLELRTSLEGGDRIERYAAMHSPTLHMKYVLPAGDADQVLQWLVAYTQAQREKIFREFTVKEPFRLKNAYAEFEETGVVFKRMTPVRGSRLHDTKTPFAGKARGEGVEETVHRILDVFTTHWNPATGHGRSRAVRAAKWSVRQLDMMFEGVGNNSIAQDEFLQTHPGYEPK